MKWADIGSSRLYGNSRAAFSPFGGLLACVMWAAATGIGSREQAIVWGREVNAFLITKEE